MACTSTFLLKRCYPATTLNQVSCFSHASIYKPAAAPATHSLLGRTKPRTATSRQGWRAPAPAPCGGAQTRSAASKVQGTNGELSTFLLQLRKEHASKASHKHHACCREHSYFTVFLETSAMQMMKIGVKVRVMTKPRKWSRHL